MDLKITLDFGGSAPRGIDNQALVENIQAEIDKLAKHTGTSSVQPTRFAPPDGAMGDASIVQWISHIASDPGMAKIYAKALILAINEIIRALKSNNTDSSGENGDKAQRSTLLVKFSALGKELILPATTEILKKFLEDIGS